MVTKCATNWQQLGKNLEINDDLLNIIEKDYPHDCERCCSKMLSEWLDLTPDASWKILYDAMDKLKVEKLQDVSLDNLTGNHMNLW